MYFASSLIEENVAVCCNSLVCGMATAGGNQVARRLYCPTWKFSAASNFWRLSTKFWWFRYALIWHWHWWHPIGLIIITIVKKVILQWNNGLYNWQLILVAPALDGEVSMTSLMWVWGLTLAFCLRLRSKANNKGHWADWNSTWWES